MTCPCNSVPCVCPRLVRYPKDWPKRFNGCYEPCDMLVGPCACGATHTEAEAATAGPLPTTGLASAESPPDFPLSAWPLSSVLNILANAANHLLGQHNCDCHGHEETRYAERAAREHIKNLEPAPAAAPLRPAVQVAAEILSASMLALTHAEAIGLAEKLVLSDRAARPEVAEVDRLRKELKEANAHRAKIASELVEACEFLERIRKYAREDKAETPRTTRLARCLAEVEQWQTEKPAADRRGEP